MSPVPDRETLIDLITQRILDALKRAPAELAAPAVPPAAPSASAPARGAEHEEAETRERLKMFHVSGTRGPEETRALAEAGAARVVATTGYCPASDGLASLIDHTLLKPDATREDVERLCREAAQFCFASVCVNPNWVPLCRDLLRGSGVKVCTVIGFPFGSHLPDVKAYEARRAVEQGAEEVDMVINIGALKSKDYATVEKDIAGVVNAVGKTTVVKVILETAMLTRGEDHGVLARQGRRGRLRQDLDRLRRGRCHRGGHPPHARDCRPGGGGQGFGRHPHQGGCRCHGGRGRHAHRRLGRRQDRAR